MTIRDCANPDCPMQLTPVNTSNIYCRSCAAERRKEKDRQRKRKPAQQTQAQQQPQAVISPSISNVIAPVTEAVLTKVEPDISEETLARMNDGQRAARHRLHRLWKEKVGAVIKTSAPKAPEVQVPVEDLAHILAEPQILPGSDFDSLSESEQSARLAAHRRWSDTAPSTPKPQTKASKSSNLDYLFSTKKRELPTDPFLAEIQQTDREDLTVFVTPNGSLYDRNPNGTVRESKLKFMRGQWYSRVGLQFEPLFEGSTVQRIEVFALPALNAQLQQKETGEWEWTVPELRVTPWPLAYKTKSGSLLYPDGSTAALRTRHVGENWNLYGQTVMVLEIEDSAVVDGLITDQQKWVSRSHWAAKEYWIAELTRLIMDVEKREVDQEIYSATLKMWKDELEILTTHTFTIPDQVTVEPPFEPIVLPKIAEEVPQRPEQRPATEPRVDVLDAATRSDLARSMDAFTALDTYAAEGYSDYHDEMLANMGYGPRESSMLEHAKSTVISTNPDAYRQQRRDIARARKAR
ncbi:MAG TPA: hypothetical protein VOA88_10945 [Candidatus Dormibacteraeota bacterium]|nr:hypothetical protein [Candidatus Dormibacteraeota bacterium]